MSQVKTSGPQFDQGEGGGGSTKSNGSPLDPAKDWKKRGPTGAPEAPYKPGTRSTSVGTDVPAGPKTSVRGGGGIGGHSRDPAAKSSGSDKAQHPNVKK